MTRNVRSEFLRRLNDSIEGEVASDRQTRALYTSDASNYRVPPDVVVAPRSGEAIQTLLALCSEEQVSVTMRGAGTSVAGNACGPGVLVDTSRHLSRVLEVDPVARTAIVEPGVVLDDLNRLVAAHGLRVGPDPSTHARCSIGGMIGNNACGPRSIRWGTTADNVISMDVALSDGRRAVFGPAPESNSDPQYAGISEARDLVRGLHELVGEHEALIRRDLWPWSRRISGYAIDRLLPERGFDIAKALVGTEGTCAVTLLAALQLVEIPPSISLLVIPFPDDVAAAGAVPALLEEAPLAVEGITAELLGASGMTKLGSVIPEGRAWLLVEASGDSDSEARDHAHRLVKVAAIGGARIIDDARARSLLWRVREESAGRATRLADGTAAWPGLEDAAVPPSRLADYLGEFHRLLAAHGLRGTTFGHFGEGCLHVRIGFDFSGVRGVERFSSFMIEAADLIVEHGGSLSGEHGDGRARSALLSRMYRPEVIDLFAEFKTIWDPQGILNPGVVVDPEPIERSLRPAIPNSFDPSLQMAFRADNSDIRSAVQRCVGIGKCVIRQPGNLMCPSFQATGNERDSTRGRARLLQEMMAGDLIGDGWRSVAVRDALDLCLSCKGCASDCPAGVDMAAYKTEFLYHHYRHRLRPRSQYSLGWLPTWLALTERVAPIADLVLRGGFSKRAVAAVAGISPDRTFPAFAKATFRYQARGWFASGEGVGNPVTLWPDSFNDHFSPEVLEAGAALLTKAGFGVKIPDKRVCCGLTWITTGQLDRARRVLGRTLNRIDDGDNPVVVLEPSCAAALRDDLPELMSGDQRAHRLSERVRTLAEILTGAPIEWNEAPGLESSRAIVQPHCHQQAILGTEADVRLLDQAGVEVDELLTGCCGLAGNFGMERGHEEIAQRVAELVLVPALHRAEETTRIVADGFSCRTQIEHVAGRKAYHLAEVLLERIGGAD